MSSEREPTPTQAGIMDRDSLQLVEWDDKVVIAQAGDGSRVRIGPGGKIDEVGSDPRPEGTSDAPGGDTEGDTPEAETSANGSAAPDASDTEGDIVDAEIVPAPRAEGEPDPRDFIPPGEEMVYDPSEPSDAWRALDKATEEEILQELAGNTLETMLYSFEQDGSMVTDLSVGGVNETIRVINERGGTRIGIAEQPPTIQETDDAWRVMVRAVDFRTKVSRWGIFEQAKVINLRRGGTRKNPFSLTIALNKAERNALAKFIPEGFRRQMIAQMLLLKGKPKEAQDAVRQLTAIGASAHEIKPPLDTPEAAALIAEVRKEYDRIKELDRLALLPKAFNQYLTTAHHSEERLRDLLGHIRQIREELEEKAAASA